MPPSPAIEVRADCRRQAAQARATTPKASACASGATASAVPKRIDTSSSTAAGRIAQTGRDARSATVDATTAQTSAAQNGTTSSSGKPFAGGSTVSRLFHEVTRALARPRRVSRVGIT